MSYAAYMFYQSVNWSAYLLIYDTDASLTKWSQAYVSLMVLGITFALSALSCRFLEMPIRRWAHSLSKGYGQAPASAGGVAGQDERPSALNASP